MLRAIFCFLAVFCPALSLLFGAEGFRLPENQDGIVCSGAEQAADTDADKPLTAVLSWDAENGGLNIGWSATRSGSEKELKIFFAKGEKYASRLGDPIATFSIPKHAKGDSGTFHLDGTQLTTAIPSSEITRILVCTKKKVIAALPDVQIIVGSKVYKEYIHPETYDAVKNGLRAAGIGEVHLTSGWRKPEDQARAMFGNLARGDVRKSIQSQYDLYADPGDEVISVFEAEAQKREFVLKTIENDAAEIQKRMTERIVLLTESGRRVSRHCVTEEAYLQQNIIDLGRKPFTKKNIPLFREAMKDRTSKILDEPENGCFHLEF